MARSPKTKKADDAGREPRPARRGPWWLPALIVLAGLVAYSNTFANPFIVDDSSSVVLNPTIRALSSWRVVRPPADHPMSGRPLVNVSFAVNYAIAGTDVAGYHAVNLALHLTCGLLVFGLIGRQLSPPLASVVALLWTVHPLNSEVVSYVTQRTESMMALCFLATMYAATARGQSRPRAQIVAVVTCALGMMCKETMAVAPLAVLLYDSVYEFGSVRAAVRARWRFYGCLASTWLIVGVLTATSGQSITAGYTFARPDPWVYLLNQGEIILRYLRLAIRPDALVLYYGWPRAVGLAEVWESVLVVALLVVVTIVALVRWPRIGALGAWVFLTLGPTSSLVPIVTEVGAERRMYLPLIGVITLAVVGAAWLWSKAGVRLASLKWAPAAIVAGLATAFTATTHARNREYASLLTMTETILARWPTPNASHLVGAALVEADRPADALPHLRQAAAGFPMARYGLADALVKTGQFPEAITEGEAFLRIAPPPAVVNARMLLAQAYVATRRHPEAIEHLTQVLATSPRHTLARALLADLLAESGRFAEAVPHYQALLAGAPKNAQTAAALGVAFVALGRGVDAVAAFRVAADAEPRNAKYCQNLARALVDHGDAAEALTQAQQAVTLASSDPVSFEILGWALARLGRTADARLSFSRALQLDPAYAPAIAGLRALGR